MHYFTIEQRETLGRVLEERATLLRGQISRSARADPSAKAEAGAPIGGVGELREVEAALARIHQPEFGLCIDCDAEIPYSRLSADPLAVRCVGCQLRHEPAAIAASGS